MINKKKMLMLVIVGAVMGFAAGHYTTKKIAVINGGAYYTPTGKFTWGKMWDFDKIRGGQ